MLNEEYKTIPGFSQYEITKKGSIRNKSTLANLKPIKRKNGYYCLSSLKNDEGVGKYQNLHKLIGVTWLGQPEDGQTKIYFKDGDKENMDADNLAWKGSEQIVRIKHSVKDYPGFKIIEKYPRYIINGQGEIISLLNAKKIKWLNNNGRPAVTLSGENKKITNELVKTLVGDTHIPCPGERDRYVLINKNGNKLDVDIENLEWVLKYKKGYVKEEDNDLYQPIKHDKHNYSYRYDIREDGTVRNRETGGIITPTLGGYPVIRLITREGTSQLELLHRLVALNYIEESRDTKLLIVNHKNGDKKDYSISNLEWVSQQENMVHARNTFLYGDSITYVKIIKSGRIYKFRSRFEACRFMGCSNRVLSRVESKEKGIYNDFEFKIIPKSDNVITWNDGSKTDTTDSEFKTFSSNIVAFNILENVVMFFGNVAECGCQINIIYGSIMKKLESGSSWPTENYCFMWEDDYKRGKRFPKFSKEEIEAFKDKKSIVNPVKITNDSIGLDKIYLNVRDFTKEFNLPKSTVAKVAVKGGYYKDFKIERLLLRHI